jgi:hypothetical protein
MTATIRDLMLANLFDVFNERDRERRTTAIARTYTDTVVFSDLDGITTGREALNEKAQKLLEKGLISSSRPQAPCMKHTTSDILPGTRDRRSSPLS